MIILSNLKAEEYKNFEEIKKIRQDGTEYWNARELSEVLQYKKWENFAKVIDRAKLACNNSGFEIQDHFPEVRKMVEIGSNTARELLDYELSRYACYLIVQNGDPRKEVIALGQTYFAIQTRRQEVADYFNQLDEDNKRLVIRGDIKQWNQMLLEVRITQTEAKLKRENVKNKEKANQTHYTVGKTVRKAIENIGGTMPENLPTPEKSVKQVEREQLKRLKNKKTKLMLDE